MSPGPWIKIPRQRPGAHSRLFCIPPAGRGASAFRAWPDYLPPSVEVNAVQLPGRENRIMEEPLSDVRSIVDRLAEIVEPELGARWAVFGHSMGALVAFELVRELRRRGSRPPEHLFASGFRAPQVPGRHPPIHTLTDDAFVAEVNLRYEAVPAEARANAELLELFLPGLRADVAVCDTYSYAEDAPLDLPIHAFGGDGDHHVTVADLEAWREQTTTSFELTLLPGGHFFVESARRDLLNALARKLA